MKLAYKNVSSTKEAREIFYGTYEIKRRMSNILPFFFAQQLFFWLADNKNDNETILAMTKAIKKTDVCISCFLIALRLWRENLQLNLQSQTLAIPLSVVWSTLPFQRRNVSKEMQANQASSYLTPFYKLYSQHIIQVYHIGAASGAFSLSPT